MLSRVGPLGTNLTFLSPLGLLRFRGFQIFLSILKLSYSKPFYSTLNYASTANIQEVRKFYNLGDKLFKQTLIICRFCPCSVKLLQILLLWNAGLEHSRSNLVFKIRYDFIFGMLYCNQIDYYRPY